MSVTPISAFCVHPAAITGSPRVVLANRPAAPLLSRKTPRAFDWCLYQQRRPASDLVNFTKAEESTLLVDDSSSFIENAEADTSEILTTHPDESGVLVGWESNVLDIPAESVLWLNAVAIVWGSQHPVIKMVVQDSDTSAFSLARFGLAALIASPYTPGLFQNKQEDNNDATTWRWGVEMGIWMFLGYAFQAIGLEYTTAQRSGFLLYLNVKLVPFFARIFFGRDISIPTWISALTALLGTALLAGGSLEDLNVGDAWSVAAAAASAMFILRLESASTAVPNSAQLNAACLWVVALLALGWSLLQGGIATSPGDALEQTVTNLVETATNHPMELLYLGGITTALANYMQTRAQKGVSAERASVIYAMDPVYGAGFSTLLLGERLNGWGIVGAGLITLAAATNAFLDFGKGKKESSSTTNIHSKEL